MAQEYAAIGTQLKIGNGSTAETFTTIAQVRNITGPGLSAEVIDVTSHDTSGNYREVLPSFLDPGEFNLEILFDPGTATHASTVANGLLNLWKNRTKRNFRIVFPSTANKTWQFAGYVTSFAVQAPYDGALSADCTISPTGAYVWST